MALASRPTGITLIGWGAIVLGVLMTFSGAMGGLASLVMPEIPYGRGPGFPAPIELIFRHFGYFAVGQVAVAIVIVAAGRGLLAGRRWSRLVIQCVAVLGLMYIIAFTAFFVSDMLRMSSFAPKAQLAPLLFGVFMVAGASFNAVFWGTPLALTVWYLRRRTGETWPEETGRRTTG